MTTRVMAAPGPGQYDPGIMGERVKGGHTLANRVSKVGMANPSSDGL